MKTPRKSDSSPVKPSTISSATAPHSRLVLRRVIITVPNNMKRRMIFRREPATDGQEQHTDVEREQIDRSPLEVRRSILGGGWLDVAQDHAKGQRHDD